MPVFYDSRNPKDLLAKRRVNTALEICKEYGFKTYDFTKEVNQIGLDVKNDFYNKGHLNVYGQRKMTDYFYDKVIKPMGIKSNLDARNTKLWKENVEVYEKTYKWITEKIDEELPYPMHYNYEVIDHIVNGTIKKYESFLKTKGKIMNKKRQADLEKERKKKKGKPEIVQPDNSKQPRQKLPQTSQPKVRKKKSQANPNVKPGKGTPPVKDKTDKEENESKNGESPPKKKGNKEKPEPKTP